MCNSSLDPTKSIVNAGKKVWGETVTAAKHVVDPGGVLSGEVRRAGRGLRDSMSPDIPPPPDIPRAAEAPTMADSSVRGAYDKSKRRRASNSGTILTGPLGAGSGSGGTLLGGG